MPGKQPTHHFDLRYLRLYAMAAGAVAVIVGACVLLGWMFDVSVLKSVLPGKVTMKPNTALCFVLCGVALVLVAVATRRRGALNNARNRVALICSGLVAIIGIVTLIEYLFTLDLKIDSLLFRNALLAETNNSTGGRMAGATALAFAFLGIALMLRDARPRILRLLSEIFSLATLLVGMVALIGYAYGIESLYSFQSYRSMAVHTALLFFLLGLGALFARPKLGLIAVITSDHGGGVMSRRVLPMAVLLSFLLGWLRLAGQRAGLYGTEFGLALFATSNITIFAVIIWLSARSLNRIDAKHRRAGEELTASEERFRQLADAMPQIVWTSRPDGWLDYYNQRWFDYTRMTLAQTEGSGWGSVLHPDDLQHCIDTWSESVRTGKPYEIKYRFRRASDGVYRWHLGRASAIHDEHGQIMKWFGTCTDIDDQKRAEEALELSHSKLETRVEERTAELEKVNLGLQEQIVERRRVEETLRELSTLNRTILDSANYTIISTDVDGTIRTFNKAAERLLGYSADEMIGKQAPAIIHDALEVEDRARLLSEELGTSIEPGFGVFVAKARSGGLDENEWSYIRRDGSRFPVLLSITALHNQDGLVTGYLGIGSDITDRKLAADALSISEKRYRELVDNGLGLICTHDLDGKLLSVNPAAADVLGYAATDMVGKNLIDYIWPAVRAIFPHYLERVAAEPSVSGLMNLQNRAGEERIWMYRNSRIAESGKGAFVLGFAQDVTEQKKIETELKQRELELVEAQHIALVGNWEWDIALNKTSLSAALYSIHGIQPEDLIPGYEGYLNLVHPDDRERISGGIVKILRDRRGGSYEHRIIWPDKSIHHHHVNVKVALGDDGQPVKLFGTAQDITDRIYLENELKEARDAAIESARLKSEFLANMSHEIRTPMNGIIGVTELVMDTAIDDEQRRYMNTIKTSGESLMTIINDILDFSKIEAGMLNFETIDFDLRFAVESVMELMDERVRAKELEMALVFRPDVPTKLCGDPTRLRQILTNLLANAVKFTDWGKVAVTVSKETEDEHRVTIRFDVRDTGIGISEDEQKMLFAPFVQADGSMTRRYGGTGLGLAISKQLVEMMGGTIGVNSEPGHGSIFTFAATFIKQASQETMAQSRSTSVDLENVRVLIVDDNRTNRQILNGHMTSWGMITEEADNDVTAITKLRHAATIGEPFHLTLLDQEMPGVKGTDLAKSIKTDPTIPDLRLVLMPSYSKHGQTRTARDVGIDAYFTKPVRQSQLLECLLAVMSEARDSGPKSLITEHSLNEIKASLNRHLLLVEDNEVNQTVALGQLAKLGYRVDVASNGQEALDALGRRSYDAVLMDCHMPVMDGYTATSEIRKREGDSKHTPIIAMTAHAMSGDREKCLAAGMDSYLAKPVKRQALAELLEMLFANGNSVNTPVAEEGPVAAAIDSLPVDIECLKDATSDNAEKLKYIIDLYVLHTAEWLEELKRAIKQEAAGDVHAIAHKCLGSSQTCGMTAIVPSLRELERIGKEGDLSGAGDQLDAAAVAFEKIKTFLEEYVNSTIGGVYV